jgi:glycerate kinase
MALTAPLDLQPVTIPTVDPWRAAVSATYGLSVSGTAVIEVAAASGYRTNAAERPRAAVDADTYGTGLLIGEAQLTVLVDVATPSLLAVEVFGPQKGADPADVEALTQRLETLARELPRQVTGRLTGRPQRRR